MKGLESMKEDSVSIHAWTHMYSTAHVQINRVIVNHGAVLFKGQIISYFSLDSVTDIKYIQLYESANSSVNV